MIKLRVKLDSGAVMPRKAHCTDAGYDLFSMEEKIVPAHGYAVFDTGTHILIPDGYCGEIMSKSGLNCKHGITSDGLVDAGYTGSIRVCLHNDSDEGYLVRKGDKISQIVIKRAEASYIVPSDDLGETERGDRGFGSSGR